jgi:Arc/MetJ family transcription regulator
VRYPYTSRQGGDVRTNIDIDDDLMTEALRATGEKTKRAVVERGLRMLIQVKRQGSIRRLRGQVPWTGDLDQSRQGRVRSAG